MNLEFESNKSIYLQIAETLENEILKGIFEEETQVPSTNQLAALYRINPATAAKGINMLVEEGILYKRRGIGMFVAPRAAAAIREKRKRAFYADFVVPLMNEASSLGISKEEIATMLMRENEE